MICLCDAVNGYSTHVCVLPAVLRASIPSPGARLHCLWPGNLTLFVGNRRYGCSLLFHTAGTLCVLARAVLARRSFRVKLWKVGLENGICPPFPHPGWKRMGLQAYMMLFCTGLHKALRWAERCLCMYTHKQTYTPWPENRVCEGVTRSEVMMELVVPGHVTGVHLRRKQRLGLKPRVRPCEGRTDREG